MFNVTDNKGFHMTFANGYTVSVQWGRGNYCENGGDALGSFEGPVPPSGTAEIAAWHTEEDLEYSFGDEAVTLGGFGLVNALGDQTSDEVATFIAKIAALPSPV